MEQRELGPLGSVSVVSLGGGGIGQVWGPTDRREAVATVRAAVDADITLLDVAPAYGNGEAESVVAEAFGSRYPDGLRISTKCMLGTTVEPELIATRLEESLVSSLERLHRDSVDAFILHDFLVPDGFSLAPGFAGAPWTSHLAYVTTPVSQYLDAIVPALQRLVQRGLAGAWGISGLGIEAATREALEAPARPGLVQCIANLLDSPGDLRLTADRPEPRALATVADAAGVGVMGVRAVQAGALTDAFDRDVPEGSQDSADYRRAAGFRRLAASLGRSPAYLAHRYALSLPSIGTVVLGAKNRTELAECLKAAEDGPPDPELIAQIDSAVAG